MQYTYFKKEHLIRSVRTKTRKSEILTSFFYFFFGYHSKINIYFTQIFNKLNLTGTVKEVFDSLKKDPRFLLNDSVSILTDM